MQLQSAIGKLQEAWARVKGENMNLSFKQLFVTKTFWVALIGLLVHQWGAMSGSVPPDIHTLVDAAGLVLISLCRLFPSQFGDAIVDALQQARVNKLNDTLSFRGSASSAGGTSMILLAALLLLTPGLHAQVAQAPPGAPATFEALPDQYIAAGVHVNPDTSPAINGSIEWGKLMPTGNTYAGFGVNILPSTKGTVQVSEIEARARQVFWRNQYLVFVGSGGFGIASTGAGNVGGAFSGEFGLVIPLKKLFGIETRVYLGMKDIKTSLTPNTLGPAFALVFTP